MSSLDYQVAMELLRKQRYEDIANYDMVVKLGIDAMWKELCEKAEDSGVDPVIVFEDEMENLRNIEYSMRLMNICCLSETWEQDLYNFLKEKRLITVASNDYANTKRLFEQAYPTCVISNYPEIVEMRALVNAIKHGEGNSLNNIRRITSDSILADSNLGEMNESGDVVRKKQIEFDNNTLTSRTLNVDGKLKIYSDAIVRFWGDVFEAERERSVAVLQE